ncbi:unnamed protein product [Macrosiphum euphorbiae]|uniref:Uncharacterized protein n=1 Tax=Macrosiphum euphorbiae TaxID=13131 RepID=A0AAV0XC19_9HEMI|nr:unnamed protein product [Macrosiphum euphorbiae]
MVKHINMFSIFFMLNIIAYKIYVSGDRALDCIVAMQDEKFIYYRNNQSYNQDGWRVRIEEYLLKGCSNCGGK